MKSHAKNKGKIADVQDIYVSSIKINICLSKNNMIYVHTKFFLLYYLFSSIEKLLLIDVL